MILCFPTVSTPTLCLQRIANFLLTILAIALLLRDSSNLSASLNFRCLLESLAHSYAKCHRLSWNCLSHETPLQYPSIKSQPKSNLVLVPKDLQERKLIKFKKMNDEQVLLNSPRCIAMANFHCLLESFTRSDTKCHGLNQNCLSCEAHLRYPFVKSQPKSNLV